MFLADLFQNYVNKYQSPYTKKIYRSKIGPFVEKFGDKQVEEITSQMVMTWFESSTADKTDAGKSMIRAKLRAFLRYCGSDAAKAIPAYSDKPQEIILPSEVDVTAALRTVTNMSQSNSPMDRRDALIVMLSYANGLRRGEIKNMRHSHLLNALKRARHDEDFGGMFTSMKTTGKTGTAFVVLDAMMINFAARWAEVRPKTKHDFLFVALWSRSYGQPLGDNGMATARRRLARAAGVDLFTYQELRRRKADRVAREYGTLEAAKVLQHKSSSGDRVINDFYTDARDRIAQRLTVQSFKNDMQEIDRMEVMS